MSRAGRILRRLLLRNVSFELIFSLLFSLSVVTSERRCNHGGYLSILFIRFEMCSVEILPSLLSVFNASTYAHSLSCQIIYFFGLLYLFFVINFNQVCRKRSLVAEDHNTLLLKEVKGIYIVADQTRLRKGSSSCGRSE